jgi:hypothetical protein
MNIDNITMNRAMRRAMKHRRQEKPAPVVPLPSLLDEFTIFDIPERILSKLRNGEIEALQGRPVFTDNTGDLQEVCPALEGWIFTWQRINDKLGLNLCLAPLRKLHNKLQACMLLSHTDVTQAQAALDSIRAIYRITDRKAIASIAQEAQIAIFMQDQTPAQDFA